MTGWNNSCKMEKAERWLFDPIDRREHKKVTCWNFVWHSYGKEGGGGGRVPEAIGLQSLTLPETPNLVAGKSQ
jgi:hypothetical protein